MLLLFVFLSIFKMKELLRQTRILKNYNAEKPARFCNDDLETVKLEQCLASRWDSSCKKRSSGHFSLRKKFGFENRFNSICCENYCEDDDVEEIFETFCTEPRYRKSFIRDVIRRNPSKFGRINRKLKSKRKSETAWHESTSLH